MKRVDWLERVIVAGGGTMGRGIAQVFLEPGYEVILVEPDPAAREEARSAIEAGLRKRDTAGSAQQLETRESVPGKEQFELGIEAVPEQLDLKRNVLSGMEPQVTELLATNTSSIPLADLDERLESSRNFVGIHFMNPAPVMSLVELVYYSEQDPVNLDRAESLVESLDKSPIRVKDSPGFVSNRLLMALINRAIRLVEQGVAEPEGVDRIMKEGMGHEMGPLEVADFIGLDVCLETMEIIDQRVEEDAYVPAERLLEKVEEGHLGEKTGQGFYTHTRNS